MDSSSMAQRGRHLLPNLSRYTDEVKTQQHPVPHREPPPRRHANTGSSANLTAVHLPPLPLVMVARRAQRNDFGSTCTQSKRCIALLASLGF
jgi:hypothetical protein